MRGQVLSIIGCYLALSFDWRSSLMVIELLHVPLTGMAIEVYRLWIILENESRNLGTTLQLTNTAHLLITAL